MCACTASSEEVRPTEGKFFFPTAIAVSPDDSHLFVVSANSDLRYDSGSVEVADVVAIKQAIDAFKASQTVPAGCAPATDGSGTLECFEDGELALFLKKGAAVRTGNFASMMAVQDRGNGALRLIVPVRGDPSITWIDWDGSRLVCSDRQGFELCDDAHRLTRLRNDPSLPIVPDEPYGVYVDSVAQFAMVTHLTSGTVTLVDSPAAGAPVLSDAVTGLFAQSETTSLRGATALGGRKPGPDNIVYVQSRSENRVQMVTVARPAGVAPYLVPAAYFYLDNVGIVAGASEDSRGIVFDGTGDRAYLLTRLPPSMQVYDTSTDVVTGAPVNRLIGGTDVCREASSIVLGDAGAGARVFVSCFNDGELYVIDPRGSPQVESVSTVGRGPFSLAIAPTKQLLFVTNFLENTIAVVDLAPDSPMLYRVILRIGVRS